VFGEQTKRSRDCPVSQPVECRAHGDRNGSKPAVDSSEHDHVTGPNVMANAMAKTFMAINAVTADRPRDELRALKGTPLLLVASCCRRPPSRFLRLLMLAIPSASNLMIPSTDAVRLA
jgi:hypothetical protein